MPWPFSASFKKNQHLTRENGFSLVELLISITIMVIVIAVISVQQGAFNGAVLLRSQAYEAALAVREVQLNAVSATGDSGIFRSVLGVHFDTAATENGQYRIFRDSSSGSDANGFYDSGEEYGKQGFLDNRFEVREIRPIGDSMQSTGGLSVVFVRPNFDARFFDSAGEVNASSVEIDISRRGSTDAGPGDVRTLEVTATGQISVKNIP
jgi:prepilin-type N-terminal cleavage/methylation domain-containing protein